MKTSTKIIAAIAIILIVIQFFGIDKSAEASDPQMDILVYENAPTEVKDIMQRACYDCHSYKTKYPWYTNVAPVSWWIAHHIEEGREHMNFAKWGEYTAEKKEHKMDEFIEEVEEGEMPLTSYTITHSEAQLTDMEKAVIMEWAKTVMEKY
ncbi:MAG: heme-binding domain-containing protein [Fulvivirga sp.]|uniref:heme-binding domain-containing protein n=1 Tax=Fulvivirga sp. TaxID=1931237 RepID=UPI0032EBF819